MDDHSLITLFPLEEKQFDTQKKKKKTAKSFIIKITIKIRPKRYYIKQSIKKFSDKQIQPNTKIPIN